MRVPIWVEARELYKNEIVNKQAVERGNYVVTLPGGRSIVVAAAEWCAMLLDLSGESLSIDDGSPDPQQKAPAKTKGKR